MLRGQGRGVQRQTPLHRQRPHGRHRDAGRPAAQPSRQEALHPKHDGLDLGRGLVLRALREEGQLQAPHPLQVCPRWQLQEVGARGSRGDPVREHLPPARLGQILRPHPPGLHGQDGARRVPGGVQEDGVNQLEKLEAAKAA